MSKIVVYTPINLVWLLFLSGAELAPKSKNTQQQAYTNRSGQFFEFQGILGY